MNDELLEVLWFRADDGDLLPVNGTSCEMSLRCRKCGGAYPIRDGIPRFVSNDQYAGNFRYEWSLHRTTQLESAPSERPFAERMGWAPDDVRGRLVFDVGCGMGRSADMVLRWGGRVVSVDLSYAVDSAGRILPTTRVSSPSRRASSNCRSGQSPSIIYSIGVLPHTPDTGRAFQCLPPLSVRAAMPRSRCTPCTPTRNKGVKSVSPETHGYDSYDWRALDTFDWYSPQYQFKHSYPEVFAWFSKAGLVNSELLDVEVAVLGRKPVRNISHRSELATCAESSA